MCGIPNGSRFVLVDLTYGECLPFAIAVARRPEKCIGFYVNELPRGNCTDVSC